MSNVKSNTIYRILTAVKKTQVKQRWGCWHRGAWDGRSM